MQLGMIGLGRMGGNMVRRLLKDGHECVVFDRSQKAVQELAQEKAVGTTSLQDFVKKLKKPRTVWMMVPAAVVDESISGIAPYLESGDILLFYCGLSGYDYSSAPALYLLGYFVVEAAGYARDFATSELKSIFANNWHVMHAGGHENLHRPDEPLVLVKGTKTSRMFTKAYCISEMRQNCDGRPLKVLSKEMQTIVGDFEGRISIQRSPTRWITEEPWVSKTVDHIRSLV